LGKSPRLRTERGAFAGETRLLRRKCLPKPPEKGRLSLVFLPRNERFQSFSADFPSDLPA
jgi:hypothetical protein